MAATSSAGHSSTSQLNPQMTLNSCTLHQPPITTICFTISRLFRLFLHLFHCPPLPRYLGHSSATVSERDARTLPLQMPIRALFLRHVGKFRTRAKKWTAHVPNGWRRKWRRVHPTQQNNNRSINSRRTRFPRHGPRCAGTSLPLVPHRKWTSPCSYPAYPKGSTWTEPNAHEHSTGGSRRENSCISRC